MLWQERKKKTNPFWQFKKEKTSLDNVIKLRNSNTILYWIAPQKLDRKNLTFGVFYYGLLVRLAPLGARRRLYQKNSKRDTIKVFKPIVKRKEETMAQKSHSLSHTKWHCKYHIVFTPKYRRKVIYNQYRSSLGEIFHRLCSYKGIEIIEGHLMLDHVHMLVSIPPRISVASFMGYLKGKSSLMMFDKHANLKYKFGNRHFWAEGYYVSTVGLNETTIKKYIQD